MSPIFRSVAIIENYLNEDQDTIPHPRAVLEAFQNLEHALEEREKSSLSRRDVEKVVEMSATYLQSRPDYHRRIEKVEAVFRKHKKGRIAQRLHPRAEQILAIDSALRTEYIDAFVEEIEQASDYDIKRFILEMAKGPPHLLRLSFDEVLLLMNERLGESRDFEALFTPYELKTGNAQRNSLPTVEKSVRKVMEKPERVLRPAPITEREIARLREERAFRLENLERVYRCVIRDPHQCVQTKYFPNTYAWYVGSCQNREEDFEFEMLEIAEKYGIAVISDSTSPRFSQSVRAIAFTDETKAAYPQDFIDFSRDEIRIPASLPDSELSNLQERVQTARSERNALWSETSITLEDGETISIFPLQHEIRVLGTVWNEQQAYKGISLASSIGVKSVMNITYSEGGNTLIGMRDDTPYLIVGEDSFVASKIILEHELGRAIEDETVYCHQFLWTQNWGKFYPSLEPKEMI